MSIKLRRRLRKVGWLKSARLFFNGLILAAVLLWLVSVQSTHAGIIGL